jgi:hypothetical protein
VSARSTRPIDVEAAPPSALWPGSRFLLTMAASPPSAVTCDAIRTVSERASNDTTKSCSHLVDSTDSARTAARPGASDASVGSPRPVVGDPPRNRSQRSRGDAQPARRTPSPLSRRVRAGNMTSD